LQTATTMTKLFDAELNSALDQLLNETSEAVQLAKASPDFDDLAATFAVALLKLGMATGFIEQRVPGFAKEVEEKRQKVIAALMEEQKKQQELDAQKKH
jgi:hypothetical protein